MEEIQMQFDYLWLGIKVFLLLIGCLLIWLGACYLDKKGYHDDR